MAFPLTSINGNVHWNAVEVDHARGWTISPTNEGKEYASNKTNGRKGRRPGNIDVTGEFTVYDTTAGTIPFLPGQIAALKLYIDAVKFWDIQNAMIMSINPAVNIEEGELEGYTVNWAFAGKDDATFGKITAPDGTELDVSTVGEIA